jgi:ribosomal protein L3
MTAEPVSLEPRQSVTASGEAVLRFLQLNARLLLEYNVRSKSLERRIESVAGHLGVDVQTVVGYQEVTTQTGRTGRVRRFSTSRRPGHSPATGPSRRTPRRSGTPNRARWNEADTSGNAS